MSVAAVSSGSSLTGVNKYAELSSESFVRIMTAELTSQDPLKPNDSSKILEQMSSLREIESSTNLTNQLKELVSQNQFSAASGLLGTVVSGIATNNTRQTGTAVSIVRTSSGSQLVLDTGFRINVNNVDSVEIPIYEEIPPPTSPPPVTPPGSTNLPTVAPTPVQIQHSPFSSLPANEQFVGPTLSGQNPTS